MFDDVSDPIQTIRLLKVADFDVGMKRDNRRMMIFFDDDVQTVVEDNASHPVGEHRKCGRVRVIHTFIVPVEREVRGEKGIEENRGRRKTQKRFYPQINIDQKTKCGKRESEKPQEVRRCRLIIMAQEIWTRKAAKIS